MYVKTLKIENFRNYARETVEFDSGVNVIVGDNAQGKTNLIEAIYFSGVGKSFRTPREREMIRSGESRAIIETLTEKTAGTDKIRAIIERGDVKRVAINDLAIARMGELMGVCAVVLFSPDELKIVKETPQERRRFMNISLSQISRGYFYLLMNYGKALSNRNKLLKSGRYGEADLLVWDDMLASYGAKIVKNRKGYLERLARAAKDAHSSLTSNGEELELSYEGADGNTEEEILAALKQSLLDTREQDMRLCFTHSGAHRDDLKITIDGIDVRSYGSQGQQRTAALSLKLAETTLMTELTGESPVLLLDDVLSELDEKRKTKLMEHVRGLQTIITATDYDGAADKVIRVRSGSIVRD